VQLQGQIFEDGAILVALAIGLGEGLKLNERGRGGHGAAGGDKRKG
jgi:hypothetical protein